MEYDGILIGQAVRDIRTERGLTIEELSDWVGKSVSHIHQLELGSRKMSVDLLLALVSVLDMDVNRILKIEKTEAVCDKEQKQQEMEHINELLCYADQMEFTEEIKEMLIDKVKVFSDNRIEIFWKFESGFANLETMYKCG